MDEAKAVLRGKWIAINVYVTKDLKCQINNLISLMTLDKKTGN